jgi:hypothetical protein
MANLISGEGHLAWWSDAVHHWVLWFPPVLLIAFLLARVSPRGVDGVVLLARGALLAPRPWMFALTCAAATIGLSLYFGWTMFGWRPVTGDEFSQGWQASLLAQGRLFARAEANSEFFSTTQSLAVDGRWFSQFPVGGPALLALGALVGAPWLVNPLLAAIAIAAAYWFFAAASDEMTARGATLLFVLSPFVVFMAGSRMNHVGTLAFLCVALAAVAAWTRATSPRLRHGFAALCGFAVGVAATIRPFDALVYGACVGAFQLHAAWKRPELRASVLSGVAAGAIPVALLLAANHATTGGALAFGYDVLNGPEHRPGFHMTPLGYEHTPKLGLYMLSVYLMKLDIGLMSWPIPALLPVVLVLALQRRATRWDHLMLAILAGVCIGYAAYWSESYFMGPRFLFVAIPVVLLYTARMPAVMNERLRSPTMRRIVTLLIPLCLLVTWAMPPGLFGVARLARFYRIGPSAATLIHEATVRSSVSNAVIFVPEGWHARLAARLRALGARPLFAELAASQYDACTLQQALDRAEALPASTPPDARLQSVVQLASRDARPQPLANLSGGDQVSLVPNRALPPICATEMGQLSFFGVNIAELMSHERLDADGRLGGRVVYARDFGARNERLRGRFPDRAWYVARVTRTNGTLSVALEPYR